MGENTDTAAIPIGEALCPEAPVLSPLDQIRQRRSRITPGAWQWRQRQGYPQTLEESYRALRGNYDLLVEQLERINRYRVGVPA